MQVEVLFKMILILICWTKMQLVWRPTWICCWHLKGDTEGCYWNQGTFFSKHVSPRDIEQEYHSPLTHSFGFWSPAFSWSWALRLWLWINCRAKKFLVNLWLISEVMLMPEQMGRSGQCVAEFQVHGKQKVIILLLTKLHDSCVFTPL